ncbi:hypothetical protein SUGI_1070280, partial [Cryptomeria japonica]
MATIAEDEVFWKGFVWIICRLRII